LLANQPGDRGRAREQTEAIDEVADSARDLQESAEALEGMLDRFTVTADTAAIQSPSASYVGGDR